MLSEMKRLERLDEDSGSQNPTFGRGNNAQPFRFQKPTKTSPKQLLAQLFIEQGATHGLLELWKYSFYAVNGTLHHKVVEDFTGLSVIQGRAQGVCLAAERVRVSLSLNRQASLSLSTSLGRQARRQWQRDWVFRSGTVYKAASIPGLPDPADRR